MCAVGLGAPSLPSMEYMYVIEHGRMSRLIDYMHLVKTSASGEV